MSPVLVCPDAFKATWRAAEVAAAIGRGLERAGVAPGDVDLCPIADGGEGTLEVLLAAHGGETRGATVRDPLGRPVNAAYGLIEDGGTAIVEVASASGLNLGDGRAEEASTYGTGELIAHAARSGARVILVAAGGSATTDGGVGAITAIGEHGGLHGAQLVVLCDVTTPFEDAARVFGPQKGADEQAVERLTSRLKGMTLALPRDPTGVPMTGAAGGLSGGLWAALDARLEPGAPFVLDALDFGDRLATAAAVVTGEGRYDATSLQGKAVGEVRRRAEATGTPVHVIAGRDDLGGAIEASTLDEIEDAAAALKLTL